MSLLVGNNSLYIKGDLMAEQIEDVKKELEEDVKSLLPLQNEVNLLQQSPEVVKYLQAVDKFKTRESLIRKTIQDQMEKNNIKKISGDWGFMTIVEKANYKAPDLNAVPAKFIKKALDTTKVGAQFKLSGTLPKGVESNPSRSLMIKLKVDDE